jgi:hypothetical protein
MPKRKDKKPKTEILALKRPSPPKSESPPPDEAPQPEGEVSQNQDEAPKSKDEVPPPKDEASKPESEDKPKEKPKRLPPLPRPEVGTNANGEEFHSGDRILTTAPWLYRDSKVESELLGFYESKSGQVWAEYKPLTTPPAGWERWEKGVMRVELLENSNP